MSSSRAGMTSQLRIRLSSGARSSFSGWRTARISVRLILARTDKRLDIELVSCAKKTHGANSVGVHALMRARARGLVVLLHDVLGRLDVPEAVAREKRPVLDNDLFRKQKRARLVGLPFRVELDLVGN